MLSGSAVKVIKVFGLGGEKEEKSPAEPMKAQNLFSHFLDLWVASKPRGSKIANRSILGNMDLLAIFDPRELSRAPKGPKNVKTGSQNGSATG